MTVKADPDSIALIAVFFFFLICSKEACKDIKEQHK